MFLKHEVKNIVRDVKVRNSRPIFDEIKRVDELAQLILIDLNTLQFKLTCKMEEVAKELTSFTERSEEEQMQIIGAFLQITIKNNLSSSFR